MHLIALHSFYVITPIFLMVGLGYVARRIGWIEPGAVKSLTRIVFYIGLPAVFIDELSRMDMLSVLQLKGPLVLFIVSVLMGMLGYLTAGWKGLPPNRRGVWAQASLRGNLVFVGLPVVVNALGEEGIRYCLLVLVVAVPTYAFLSVLFLLIPHRKAEKGSSIKLIAAGIITNPLIISCFAGFGLSFFRPEHLPVVDTTLSSLRKIALPVALLAVGGQLELKKSIRQLPRLYLPVLYRLVLAPTVGGTLLYLFGAGREDMVASSLLLGCPVAVVSYVMADEMKGDSEEAANLILSSTFASYFTLGVILFVLGVLGVWVPGI